MASLAKKSAAFVLIVLLVAQLSFAGGADASEAQEAEGEKASGGEGQKSNGGPREGEQGAVRVGIPIYRTKDGKVVHTEGGSVPVHVTADGKVVHGKPVKPLLHAKKSL